MPIKNRNIAVCIILTLVTCGIYGLYWEYMMIQEIDSLTNNPNPQNPIVVILLSIVTCTIYLWIWLFNTGKRIDALNQNEGKPASNYGTLFLVLAIIELSIVDWALIQNTLNEHSNC